MAVESARESAGDNRNTELTLMPQESYDHSLLVDLLGRASLSNQDELLNEVRSVLYCSSTIGPHPTTSSLLAAATYHATDLGLCISLWARLCISLWSLRCLRTWRGSS